ncbi:hypothetical protein L2747_18825 [Shewanella marinintestina]|uniref:hypothetical protein n=1 Tax=Shewanella marinintestina TaxID=190305 RepID=UPI002010A954|nr:hypothetical protein [Shewanella marinintestina]MCL1148061.1 hypothetical protein [Shewanella marinintestina]
MAYNWFFDCREYLWVAETLEELEGLLSEDTEEQGIKIRLAVRALYSFAVKAKDNNAPIPKALSYFLVDCIAYAEQDHTYTSFLKLIKSPSRAVDKQHEVDLIFKHHVLTMIRGYWEYNRENKKRLYTEKNGIVLPEQQVVKNSDISFVYGQKLAEEHSALLLARVKELYYTLYKRELRTEDLNRMKLSDFIRHYKCESAMPYKDNYQFHYYDD